MISIASMENLVSKTNERKKQTNWLKKLLRTAINNMAKLKCEQMSKMK